MIWGKAFTVCLWEMLLFVSNFCKYFYIVAASLWLSCSHLHFHHGQQHWWVPPFFYCEKLSLNIPALSKLHQPFAGWLLMSTCVHFWLYLADIPSQMRTKQQNSIILCLQVIWLFDLWFLCANAVAQPVFKKVWGYFFLSLPFCHSFSLCLFFLAIITELTKAFRVSWIFRSWRGSVWGDPCVAGLP